MSHGPMEGEKISIDEHALQLCQLLHWQEATGWAEFQPSLINHTFFFWPVLTTLKWDHGSQCTAVKLLIPCADMSCIGCAIVPASQCPFGSKSVENKMKKIKNKRWLDVLAEALRSAYTNINTWDAAGERAWLYWYTGKNAGLYFKCGK